MVQPAEVGYARRVSGPGGPLWQPRAAAGGSLGPCGLARRLGGPHRSHRPTDGRRGVAHRVLGRSQGCLLYTSDAADDM
eukprot:8465789-Alexandrium_andersonii.AAC.1